MFTHTGNNLMKKRFVATLLTAAMVISLFTGCGSKAESDTDKTEKETTESTAEEAPVKEGEVNSGTFTMSFDMSSYEKDSLYVYGFHVHRQTTIRQSKTKM